MIIDRDRESCIVRNEDGQNPGPDIQYLTGLELTNWLWLPVLNRRAACYGSVVSSTPVP
jgi:hypothetical protein